ncbi:MAG: ABC transporter ATP-binding protein [Spirochaetales bacterium]|nr:ABC transporter ATP-binding protein [Spirochaetales bacterium]
MNSNDKKVLEVKNLTVTYESEGSVVEAVNGINLDLTARKTVGLVGETGAGKTTTALSLLGLVQKPQGHVKNGKIIINGKNILEMTEKELENIRGKEIAMIFQDPMTALNPVMTVGDQIAESIVKHEKVKYEEAFAKASELLETVGIDKARAKEYPHQFSGGMRQRVVIAIALACRPGILIADEPTTALDVTIQAQVLDMMKKLKDEYETSMIMITHDLGVVAEICDEVAVMYAGHILEYGVLEDIFNRTKHPYTEGLFNSIPDINDDKIRLVPIDGGMPDPSNLPKGCVFHPRCPYADEKCKTEKPELKNISETHQVACIAYDRPGFSLGRSNS